jgi:hypothetical protein
MDKTTNAIEYIFSLGGFLSLINVLVLGTLFFYIIFAFILTRQVKLLNKSFSTPSAPFLAQIVSAHFILSIVVALMALTSL